MKRLENVAIVLTNYGLETSNETVSGYANSMETYVRVRWQWMILPVVLELSSCVLLISTIFHSRRKKIPTWKSSILAIIYHEVEGLYERRTHATERSSGMEVSAKAADMELFTNEDGVNSTSGRRVIRAID